jgi:hypothetical protein
VTDTEKLQNAQGKGTAKILGSIAVAAVGQVKVT